MNRIFTVISFLCIAVLAFGQISPEKVLIAKKHNVWCVAYSDDGKFIASGGDDGSIVVYDANSYAEVTRFEGLKDVSVSVCFSHDGTKLAAGGKDQLITVWDFKNKTVLYRLKGHKGYIMKVEFSPDDKLIASASYDKTIKLWDAATGALKYTLEGHTNKVNTLDFSPNGERLASGSGDKTVKIWNVKNGSLFLSIPAHDGWVRSVAYSPDGSLIASAGDDRKIHIWDAYSGKLLNTFLGHKNWVSALGFSPDGNYLISGGQDNILILTDLRTGKMVFQSEKQNNKIMAIAFNPKGTNFAFAALLDPELQVWNTRKLNIKPLDQKVAQQASSSSGMVPQIEWIFPKTNQTSNEASLLVKADIHSESSLRKIEIYVNDRLFSSKDRAELMLATADNNITHYKELVVLNVGENTLQVKATNIAGESDSKKLIVNYSAVPVELLSWINPGVPVTETSSGQFEVKANINKAGIPQEVTFLLNGNAVGSESLDASGGEVQQLVNLLPGENRVKIKVKTANYTKESDIRIINYTPAKKPEIAWVHPTMDTISFISGINVQARVSSMIPIDNIEIQVNGKSVYTKNGIGANSYDINKSIQVPAGSNQVRILASNKAGETVSRPLNLTYQIPEKTNISWITPASNFDIYTQVLELKACVQSRSVIKSIKLYNNDVLVKTVNSPTTKSTGECTFELNQTATLNQGINLLKIEAENMAGSTYSEPRSVNYIIPQLAVATWVEPSSAKSASTEKNITVKACIKSNTPILGIDLIANNQIISTEPKQQNLEGLCTFDYEQIIALNSGNNMLMLKVRNLAGESVSQPLFIEQRAANPYRFALVIGNEDYSSYQTGINSESNVDFAINDAREFKELCMSKFGIKDEKIIYLENARQMEMVRAVNKLSLLIKASEGKAEVYVYYAGHGFPDEKTKEPFLIPVDVSGTDLAYGGGIKLTQFYELLTEFPAKRVTVFLDACFSGGARNQGLVAARGVKIVPKETQKAVKKNLIVYTASSGSETSLPYKEKKHGMFTYYLLKKLNETNGNITYKDLSDYLKYEVNVNSLMINNKEQQPQTNVSEEVGDEWKNWKFNE